MCTRVLNRYLFWFANEHVDFRYSEIQAILSLLNINLKYIEKSPTLPYCVVELPCEKAARLICSRSVSMRFCIELWEQAACKDDLHTALRAWPQEQIKVLVPPQASFKINVETFCCRQTQAEKVDKIESFNYLPLEGAIKLSNPDITLQYIEFYGLDSNTRPTEPYNVFFGRWIADGQRDLITKLSLKTRKFIGNTTMDPQLSLLMANQAQIQAGDLVLDPFVGSGSLLVSAAQFGAYVWGTDIDILMLHGKTRPSRIQKQKHRAKDESVRANLEQYGRGSQYLDVVVADSSLPMWHPALRLDAIITDPPYGIREATERLGSTKPHQISPHHIPSKVDYELQHIYRDLLELAARHLLVGGHLVCWLPVVTAEYSEQHLPSHPCLRLVANSEQVLNSFTGRRLLTFKKLHEPGGTGLDIAKEIVMEDFRAKFFRCGEDFRKERKSKKASAVQAYKQANALQSRDISE